MFSEKRVVDKTLKLTQILKDNTRLIDSISKNLIDSSQKRLFVITNGAIIYANQCALRATGYCQKDLSGIDIDTFFATQPAQSIKAYLSKTAGFKRKQDYLQVKVNGKGNEKWFIPAITRFYWKGKPSLLLSLNDLHKETSPKEYNDDLSKLIRHSFKATGQALWYYEPYGLESYVGPEFFDLLGYKQGTYETSVRSWVSVLHHDSAVLFNDIMTKLPQTEKFPVTWEYRAKTSNASLRWFQSSITVTEWDKNGAPVKVVGVQMDIDERKRKEAQTDECVQILNGIINGSRDGFVILNQNGIVNEWNPVIEQISGIRKQQAVGRFIGDLPSLVVDTNDAFQDSLFGFKEIFNPAVLSGGALNDEKTVEVNIKLPNGDRKTIEKKTIAIKTQRGYQIVLFIKDISGTTGTLQKLEKNEERLKIAMAAGKIGVWDIDLVTGETYFSPMAFNALGYLPWEVEPSNALLRELLHPDDLPDFEQNLRSFLISGTSTVFEVRARKKDMSYAWILSKNRILRDNFGKALRITGTISDISHQKQVELDLVQSEELLKKNIRQHELLSEISYTFNTNSPIANKCSKVLELLGQFTNSSRVYIFENFPEKGITSNTFEWCNRGITPQLNNLQEVPLDMVMSWANKSEYFTSNDLANDLPPDLAEIMISQGIESFIIFPIQVSGELFGFIGFDECSYPRVWEKHEISLLKTISNIISFAFERERITSQLKRNEVLYRGLTEKLPQIVFEVTSTGRVSFLNKAGTKFFGISPDTLAKGINLWDLFPIREVYRMKDMLGKITESADFKSLNLNTSLTYNNIKPLNIYFRPIIDEQGEVCFSGLALPVLGE